MESIGKIVKVSVFAKASSFAEASEDGSTSKGGRSKAIKIEVNKYLHSPAHLLADELSVKLNDKKHFGFYLKMAMSVDHAVLRRLMGEVLENKNVQTPGKLFAYLIKRHNQEQKTASS